MLDIRPPTKSGLEPNQTTSKSQRSPRSFFLYRSQSAVRMESQNYAIAPVFWPQLVPRSQFLAIMSDSQKLKDQIREKTEEVEYLRSKLATAQAENLTNIEKLRSALSDLEQMQIVIRNVVPRHQLGTLQARFEPMITAVTEVNDQFQNFKKRVEEKMVLRQDLLNSRHA